MSVTREEFALIRECKDELFRFEHRVLDDISYMFYEAEKKRVCDLERKVEFILNKIESALFGENDD